jgi:hypothetical protein
MKRIATAEEVAHAIAFLLHPSTFTTGALACAPVASHFLVLIFR